VARGAPRRLRPPRSDGKERRTPSTRGPEPRVEERRLKDQRAPQPRWRGMVDARAWVATGGCMVDTGAGVATGGWGAELNGRSAQASPNPMSSLTCGSEHYFCNVLDS